MMSLSDHEMPTKLAICLFKEEQACYISNKINPTIKRIRPIPDIPRVTQIIPDTKMLSHGLSGGLITVTFLFNRYEANFLLAANIKIIPAIHVCIVNALSEK